MRWLLVTLLATSCGVAAPAAYRHGQRLEAYGFRCECGDNTFYVVHEDFETMKVRCFEHDHDWILKKPY